MCFLFLEANKCTIYFHNIYRIIVVRFIFSSTLLLFIVLCYFFDYNLCWQTHTSSISGIRPQLFLGAQKQPLGGRVVSQHWKCVCGVWVFLCAHPTLLPCKSYLKMINVSNLRIWYVFESRGSPLTIIMLLHPLTVTTTVMQRYCMIVKLAIGTNTSRSLKNESTKLAKCGENQNSI